MKINATKKVLSIRYKLMAFVAGICALLIALVWFINVPLLEPLYRSQIKQSLYKIVNSTQELILKYGEIEPYANKFKEDFMALNLPIAGKCFEIASEQNLCLMGYEGLQEHCTLHPQQNKVSYFGNRTDNWDSTDAILLRVATRKLKEISDITQRANVTQMVVSREVNGYIITVTADLERVGEAVKIFSEQLGFVVVVMLVISLLGAYLFSRWFTRPITELSNAAREVARGNYQAKVSVKGDDEFAELCEDFNQMTREVARTNQLQRDIIANISHDLRTPLTLIKGYAETVRDLTGDIPEKRNEQLSVIVEETDRLSGLVNSVMELSRYSSGNQLPSRVKFNLSELCEEVAYRYADICEKNGYKLNVEASDECIINADADQISRVLHNLLSNALHHVGEDGYLALRTVKKEKVARVEIEDHGDGISENDLPYIFDRYYRTRASAGKIGTGLGLSITKAILQNHNYAYGVTSSIGKGTIFWFEANMQ